MKTSADKSSTTTSTPATKAASQPFFSKAGGGDYFAPAVKMKMAVSKPGDKLEHEADRMADKVMRMSSPVMPSPGKEEKLQRAPDGKLQRQGGDGVSVAGANVQSAIQSKRGGGQPLSSDVRGYMEPRFNADFSNVRIHSNPESASLSNQLSARAFTYQNNIFFSRNQYQPGSSEGKQLLAHELTHTIQQGHAVQRSPQVSTTTAPPTVQRLFGLDLDPRSFFAGKAAAIPGFTMLTVVIGSNPITGASVDRSPGNILRGAIEMIPVAGALISQALDNHGVFEKVSIWASQQFNTLSSIGGSIRQSIADFISNFDILSPGAMLERGKQLIAEPIARIKNFAGSLKEGIVTFIKDAILKPIAAFAKANVPNGYDLLCAVLGKDPISGETVPQTAENLIAPFMKLIGQEEVWENMKKSNVIGRAWAWFQKALGTVKGFVQELPTLFMNALKALDVIDIVLIPRAFSKLVGVFGGFAGRFISWAGTAVWNLLEIIFDAVSPGALGYIKKTGSAIKRIFQNPLPFVGNLVKAAKQGFLNFADNIGGHLKAGLINWLTGSLSGVYIPKALNLAELGKFALSILGITWAQIRGKIVKVLGPNGEKIMQGLETGFDIVVALVKGGPAAAWELIKEKLTDLKDTVISGIVGFVTDTVVKKAIPKLIAMFIPGAGFISAIMSIYDTVMVFVEKISKIIQVVTAFIDSIVTIAAGNITAAANRVESILGGLLSLAISFLAGFLGLGKITDKIKAVIEKVRATVDKGIDAVIGWIVGKAKSLIGKFFGKGDKEDDPSVDVKDKAKTLLLNQLKSEHKKAELDSITGSIFQQLQPKGLIKLELGTKTNAGEYPIFAEASPRKELLKLVPISRKVKMTVSLKLSGDEPILDGVTTKLGTHSRRDDKNKMVTTAMAAPLSPVEGKSTMGGLLIPPEKGSDEVQLVSWNTGDIDPKIQSNGSHAERQFISWMERQPIKWRLRIAEIDAHINFSPCILCAADLSRIISYMPELKTAKFTWEKPYKEGPLATTTEALASMKKWDVNPKQVPGVQEAEFTAKQ